MAEGFSVTKLNEDVVGRDIQPATYNLASTIKRSSFVFGDRLNDTRLMILAVVVFQSF